MNARTFPILLISSAIAGLTAFPAHAAQQADDARLTAVMEKMNAASAELAALETTLLRNQAEIGEEAGMMLARQLGLAENLVAGREAEFGRAIVNLARTFQMTASYEHRANDSLVKRDLEWLQYLKDKGLMADAVRHDIAIKTPLFLRRAEWIKRTGDYALALDSMTDISCFRDMAVADGFQKAGLQLTYLSPYKKVHDAGTKRGMFTLTEQEIHEQFTIPTLVGYGKVLGVDVDVSPWKEDRMITIRVVPPETSDRPLQTAVGEQH